ncbi:MULTISPECIES: phytanoyl-CoA dioxygenase family protein [Myroides]|uniref:Phytanoyl-CoA dioxygenase n=1 Tax=Myroides albus TaxID=2562892 RepID=A0A6I3LLG5_9FLAO|nr:MULTISPECIES: phytanoyl-CoA dioxygenase family protein [Myroides]MTG98694.1 phytanoyl-CoA dioxygenase [Myroides albus]MVX35241.1 phytanoyl-CoA dioxygenase [Myroides sp. LoEW2-1]UVD78809.1 phytanoyl-CoA dioxygenase family protein [Myroides albus]
MYNHFHQNSYLYLPLFFSEGELAIIEPILINFHEKWLKDYQDVYKSHLINSHSLTGSSSISTAERMQLFKFIASERLLAIVENLFPAKAKFLNTQLFFDPYNKEQKNYWHRDIQYTGLSIEEQQEKIKTENVIHFRIPLTEESGIELIPGSHHQWDLPIEEDTRLSQHGRQPSDALERGQIISLNRGDLLIFSANSIHRGLYGNNRFSLDIIYCDDIPAFKVFIDERNQPTDEELSQLNNNVF